MALQTDEDTEGGRGVQLMTIHASKGLEFDTVFLTGCEEGTLPLPVASEDVRCLPRHVDKASTQNNYVVYSQYLVYIAETFEPCADF